MVIKKIKKSLVSFQNFLFLPAAQRHGQVVLKSMDDEEESSNFLSFSAHLIFTKRFLGTHSM